MDQFLPPTVEELSANLRRAALSVYIAKQNRRNKRITVAIVTVVAVLVAVAITLLAGDFNASSAPATTTAPVSVLARVQADDAPAFTPFSVADRGVVLYQYMHSHGATMPPSWAQIVDDNHALICHNYAANYAGWPAGDRDDYGVTVPLAKAALAATGFCS